IRGLSQRRPASYDLQTGLREELLDLSYGVEAGVAIDGMSLSATKGVQVGPGRLTWEKADSQPTSVNQKPARFEERGGRIHKEAKRERDEHRSESSAGERHHLARAHDGQDAARAGEPKRLP